MKLGPVSDASCSMTMTGKAGRSLNTYNPESTSSYANGSTSSGRKSFFSGDGIAKIGKKLFGKKSNTEVRNSNNRETLTGSIEFLTVQKGNTITRELSTADFVQPSSYKLIDLGTAVGVHEDEDLQGAESLMTMTEMAFAG
jgi:hypothetical protein